MPTGGVGGKGDTGRPLQSLRIPAREGDNGSQTWRKVTWTFSGTGGWMGQRALYTGEGCRRGGRTHKVSGKPMESTVFLQRGEGIPNKREEHLQEYSVLDSREGMGLLICAPHGCMLGRSGVPAAEVSPPRWVAKGQWEQPQTFSLGIPWLFLRLWKSL